jgi:Inositol hexakisphosphate
VSGLPVYGVAIPTISGLRTVLDLLGAAKGRRKVLWFNLREEPVLYINGRPFVVREADKPFANLEYTGIDRDRVEDMEARLKADVLAEASIYNGAVMVAHEDDSFQVIEDWEAVTEVDVQTPAEVYSELIKEGYDVDYLRVPITDEKAPKGDDFESLISRCWSPPEGAALMFNCQMGRGRTTTGMTIGCLLHLRKVQGVLAPPPTEARPDLPPWFVEAPEHQQMPMSPPPARKKVINNNELAATENTNAAKQSEDDEFKHGGYIVIRSLLRALENGRAAKSSLDLVLDACAAMQNLREAIASYRTRLFYEANEIRKQSLLQVCLEYLERYYVLVEFAAYLDDPGFDPGRPSSHITFAAWREARPELKGILQRLIRSNPLAALALDRSSITGGGRNGGGGGGGGGAIPSSAGIMNINEDSIDEELEHQEEQNEQVLAHRDGSVLGPHTILKQDHFPGCQSSRLKAFVPGAPNFRGVPGDSIRVYGGAIATEEGVRRVLEEVGAGPDVPEDAPKRVSAVWHMMREEPVVYISGQPYVLREESRPFKNLLEYRGIDAERLDQMEQRLKNDVVEEAIKEGGKILVTLETSAPSGGTAAGGGGGFNSLLSVSGVEGIPAAGIGGTIGHSLRQEYVPVPSSDAVVTPAQIFQTLQKEGYRVTFLRVPLTDGTCPRPVDFDSFYSAAAAAGPSDALIYSCQLGGGRTTTGMAIGTLLRMHLNGAVLPVASELERMETFNRLDEDVGGDSPRGGSDDEDDNNYLDRGPSFLDAEAADAAIKNVRGDGDGDKDVDDKILPPSLPSSCTGAGATANTKNVTFDVEEGSEQQKTPQTTVPNNRAERAAAAATAATDLPSIDPETKNLQEGEYVGMRRFTRILERGTEAKTEVDAVVDACGTLINLRTSIMRYRKPKNIGKFFRPEIQARHSAFQRGSAYLERYCMLVAFAVYLHQCRLRGRSMTFTEWLTARPDIVAAREALHQNPAGALAPVPSVPPLTPAVAGIGGGSGTIGGNNNISVSAPTPVPYTAGKNVPVEEVRHVLMRRKGSTVGRRSILKSFTMASRSSLPSSGGSIDNNDSLSIPGGQIPISIDGGTDHNHNKHVEGVTDSRTADGLPVHTVGAATVKGLRKLLESLGARPGGPTHVIITDLREELVLYINGIAYLRRELEMPAAALHHAGIQAAKLEDLERRLRADILAEAASWGGKILLHREVESLKKSTTMKRTRPTNSPSSTSSHLHGGIPIPPPHSRGGGGGDKNSGRAATRLNFSDAVVTNNDAGNGKLDPLPSTTSLGEKDPASAVDDNNIDGAAEVKQTDDAEEDITKTTEYQATTEVTAFWETAGEMGDIDSGMCTPSEVFIGLAAEGYQINYRRVPLSRERTPQAADLNHLHQQMTNHPGEKSPAYLFVSRTATGSSARFAAAFACLVQKAKEMDALGAAILYGSSPPPNVNIMSRSAGAFGSLLNSNYSSGADSPIGGGGGGVSGGATIDGVSPLAKRQRGSNPSLLLQRNDSDLSDLVRSAEAGEYRGVMNLCRVLAGGTEAKAAVDEAIDACEDIGNLRDDILKCKQAAENEEDDDDPSVAAAARRLGFHYLQRYFLLIAFRVFLDSAGARGPAPVAFSEWVAQRKEITYLLSTLELE